MDAEYERIAEEYAEVILKSDDLTGIESNENNVVQGKIIDLCPELALMYGMQDTVQDYSNGNIRVRHVQPMLPGKHVVCRNTLATEPEPQLRRSPTNQRYFSI